MNASQQFNDYAAFWPFYLSQHCRRATRSIHIAGTLLALAALALSIVNLNFGWLVVALGFGYGLAWIGHSIVEKNQPATFAYPLWSLRADFHMLGLWLSGKLEAELVKYKIMT